MRRKPVFLWAAVVVVVGAFFGAATFAIVNAAGDGVGPDPTIRGNTGAFVEPRGNEERLFLAGSGSNLPLTRALVDAFVAGHPERAKVVVFESIGSSGGVRAARDQAVEIGLISRSLREREQPYGLQVVPYARVAVVVAANPSVSDTNLTRDELVEIYSGRRTTWSDGAAISVLQREQGDSSHAAFARVFPAFARADAEAYAAGRFRVVYHDRAMQNALFVTEGGVGLFDFGAVQTQGLALRLMDIDGVRPSVVSIEDGSYPFYKDLSFVYTSESGKRPLVQAFLAFVASDGGQQVIRDGGYMPLVGGGQ